MSEPTKSLHFSGVNDWIELNERASLKDAGPFKLTIEPRKGYFRVIFKAENMEWRFSFMGNYQDTERFAFNMAKANGIEFTFEPYTHKFPHADEVIGGDS